MSRIGSTRMPPVRLVGPASIAGDGSRGVGGCRLRGCLDLSHRKIGASLGTITRMCLLAEKQRLCHCPVRDQMAVQLPPHRETSRRNRPRDARTNATCRSMLPA